MKATVSASFNCECGRAMMDATIAPDDFGSLLVDAVAPTHDAKVVKCVNVQCPLWGKKFEVPTFELKEVTP
jgi:hypothetical protein